MYKSLWAKILKYSKFSQYLRSTDFLKEIQSGSFPTKKIQGHTMMRKLNVHLATFACLIMSGGTAVVIGVKKSWDNYVCSQLGIPRFGDLKPVPDFPDLTLPSEYFK
ncbi:uncharacterized protein LOC106666378 [Cimex lectularius]|uniref:Uncharacterized protein n=1 Tax=Cimex lectularius TaxID=79782 RepID=A0A8I6RPG8_CIMLE|nr:uncharacterized protein LOC106666378 [Cimex lectularius]